MTLDDTLPTEPWAAKPINPNLSFNPFKTLKNTGRVVGLPVAQRMGQSPHVFIV